MGWKFPNNLGGINSTLFIIRKVFEFVVKKLLLIEIEIIKCIITILFFKLL